MKWFKHISDSLDDPFIFELCEECGASGYYVFFGVLEIYAREFKVQDDFKLSVTRRYLVTKLSATRPQLVIKALDFCNSKNRFTVKYDGKKIEIFIPKFKKYLDEFTLKKLREIEKKSGTNPDNVRSESGSAPKNVRTDVDVDVDVDKNIKKNIKKKKFTHPSCIEVQSYFTENGYTAEAGKKAWEYYEAGNWTDSTGKPVINWKQKVRIVFFKDENKAKPKAERLTESERYYRQMEEVERLCT